MENFSSVLGWTAQKKIEQSYSGTEGICRPIIVYTVCTFCSSKSMRNDFTLDCWSTMNTMILKKFSPPSEYGLNEKKNNLCYFFVNENYSNWVTCLRNVAYAISKEHKTFSSAQEAARKSWERAFGFLISRWHILSNLWSHKCKEICEKVVE